MCDYSLQHLKSRPAVVGEDLTVTNFSAGTRDRYAQIMGCKPEAYDRVVQNVRDMVEIKRTNNLKVTIGLQMVLMPQDADIVPRHEGEGDKEGALV